MTDSTILTNDKFGYSSYAFVFPVSPEITTKVAAIEQASRMTRAKIPAHITVKGTFHKIADLGEVRAVARRVISGARRFRISADGVKSARAMIDKTNLGPGFDAYAIDLMGRRGPAYGGTWELVERFPLA